MAVPAHLRSAGSVVCAEQPSAKMPIDCSRPTLTVWRPGGGCRQQAGRAGNSGSVKGARRECLDAFRGSICGHFWETAPQDQQNCCSRPLHINSPWPRPAAQAVPVACNPHSACPTSPPCLLRHGLPAGVQSQQGQHHGDDQERRGAAQHRQPAQLRELDQQQRQQAGGGDAGSQVHGAQRAQACGSSAECQGAREAAWERNQQTPHCKCNGKTVCPPGGLYPRQATTTPPLLPAHPRWAAAAPASASTP